MRFFLLDRVESYEPGARLVGCKSVTYSEDYLQDHFPDFPVLPGVFTLEAATQAAAWLLRLDENYAHSFVTLKQAKNVKYADFVRPGSKLTVTAEMMKKDDREATFKVAGVVSDDRGDRTNLTGRLVLERYNLAETDPSRAGTDADVIRYLRQVAGVMGLDSLVADGSPQAEASPA